MAILSVAWRVVLLVVLMTIVGTALGAFGSVELALIVAGSVVLAWLWFRASRGRSMPAR